MNISAAIVESVLNFFDPSKKLIRPSHVRYARVTKQNALFLFFMPKVARRSSRVGIIRDVQGAPAAHAHHATVIKLTYQCS